MREQDAAHSFENAPIWYTKDQMYDWLIRENYSEQIAKELSGKWADDLQGAFNKGYEKGTKELTRLRSELQQAKQETANHIAVNSLLTDSDGEADLANKLYKATSELQQERDFRKELVEGLEGVIRLKALIEYPQNTKEKHIGEAMAISGMLAKVESLIKKAKNN